MKNQPIKILYTIPNFDTAGSGKALLKIATRLNRNQFEPHICCFHNRGAFFKVVEESGIPIHIYPYTTAMIPRLKGLKNSWRISRFFSKNRFDLVHSFHYSSDYSEALAARLAGTKWIFTKKNMNWGGSSKNSWKLRSWLASGIIAQNTDMLAQFYPGWKKVNLIPRGVDIEEFSPNTEARVQLRKKMNLSPEHRLIICVANLVPVKGIEVLIESFQQVAPRFFDASLIIAGEDNSEYAKALKKEVSLSKIQSRILFTGKVLNVSDYLNAANIFVLPTLNKGRKEGSPVSLLEAMATEKVVLASKIPGIKDQLQNFPDLLFEAGNVAQLTQKLEDWLSRPASSLLQTGNLLRKEVLERFSIDREVSRHEKKYLATVSN